jgi:uncharacterized membrane protein YbhN (UPF0104 family)
MGTLETFLDSLNNVEWVQSLVDIGLLYICFMALYLFATYLVYYVRYRAGRRKLKKYYGHLRHINRMYDKEAR